ncbi:hypothetical protein NECID01_1695 [Nematocida sp. AWRm77]|nr:hypothetical protein NECID01_1695 [Nematocida sp. AWRm77]
MAGVNGYFNGKYVSKRESYVILLACVVSIIYGTCLYVAYFANSPTLTDKTDVSILNTYLFVSHTASTIVNSIIIMEGFLERNILQIILITLINFVLFLAAGLSVILYDNQIVIKFVFFGLSMMNVVFNLFILLLAFTLRKEFGWFYYKGYGADPKTNMVCTIRKARSVFLRLRLEAVLAFWIFNWRISARPGILVADTAAYYLSIVLYILESKYESYILRSINIILCLTILAYLIQEIPAFLIFGQTFEGSNVREFRYHFPIITNIAVKIFIVLGYIITLVVDAFFLKKGFHEYYTQRQRKKVGLQ